MAGAPALAPLVGVRVLDLSRLLPGPFMTQVLAELGADVVKVEEPGTGDYARWIGPDVDGHGYVFTATNRGKRSVAVDLKRPEGVDIVRRLAATSDVLVESFRPGVLDRLGLGDDALAALNPRLVRVGLVGYGPGELRDDVGHDLNYLAVAGVLAITGTPERPVASPLPVADMAGASYGVIATLAALMERDRTGRGRRVEVALADAALAFNAPNLARALAPDELPARGAWELAGGIPGYAVYRCADGGFVALGALEPKFWARFCAAVGEPDLEGAHLSREPADHARVASLFAKRGRDEWVALLRAQGVPATPVLDPREALALHAARFGGAPGPASPLTGEGARGAAPALGEHTDEVLRERLALDADALARLRREGVVA